jgi:glucosylceramidase
MVAAVTNRDKLLSTSFMNTNGSLVIVVMNQGDERLNYRVCIGEKAVETTALAHSISTIVIK